jgi:hypothetical protein
MPRDVVIIFGGLLHPRKKPTVAFGKLFLVFLGWFCFGLGAIGRILSNGIGCPLSNLLDASTRPVAAMVSDVRGRLRICHWSSYARSWQFADDRGLPAFFNCEEIQKISIVFGRLRWRL